MHDIEIVGMQPLAYWSFEDCFTFAEKEAFNLHPLHEKGYPSVGDVHSTLPVDRSKWYDSVQHLRDVQDFSPYNSTSYLVG